MCLATGARLIEYVVGKCVPERICSTGSGIGELDCMVAICDGVHQVHRSVLHLRQSHAHPSDCAIEVFALATAADTHSTCCLCMHAIRTDGMVPGSVATARVNNGWTANTLKRGVHVAHYR